MNTRRVALGDRDYKILFFLWKWKISTTRVIAIRFYKDSTVLAAYKRLRRLFKGGFVELITSRDGTHHFWILDSLGFEVIKRNLPDLREEGYKSENLKHDFFASTIQLGDWLVAEPSGVALFSEQQLRRYDPKSYPTGINRLEIHRPDGYWILGNGQEQRLIALELELSQKMLMNYSNVATFYLRDAKCDRVIWVTKSSGMANSIQRKILETIPQNKNIHSFTLLNDFIQLGWQAKVLIGKDQGKSVSELLGQKPVESRSSLTTLIHFDTRKIPMNSASNNNIETLKHLN